MDDEEVGQWCACEDWHFRQKEKGPNYHCKHIKDVLKEMERQMPKGKLKLKEAQILNRCRICGERIRPNPGNPIILNYGKEYAHELCLQKIEKACQHAVVQTGNGKSFCAQCGEDL